MTLAQSGKAALAVAALMACAGCSAGTTTASRAISPQPSTTPVSPATTSAADPGPIPTSSSGTVVPAPPVPTVVPRLDRDLVGSWETQHWLDSTGSRAIVRTYRFAADGRYEYTLAVCQSSSNCTIQSFERGSARAANGVLSLTPETVSVDGPRSYPYAVGRDPNVGDLQLHLALPNGEVDIFYAA
jgi:hypothetical protein